MVGGNVLPPSLDVDDGFSDDTLNVTDIDGLSVPNGGSRSINSTYGSLEISDDGSYQYTVNNALPQVQALDEGQAVTEVFTFTLTDNDGATSTSTITITVIGENDPPVISGVQPEVDAGFVNQPVQVFPVIDISDVDDPNIESATIRIINFVPGEDILSLSGPAPAGLAISINNSTGTVQIVGTASQATYEAAIQLLEYTNTNVDPTPLQRIASVTVNDGEENSNTQQTVINTGFSFTGLTNIFRSLQENTLFTGSMVGSLDEVDDFDPLGSVTLTPFFAGSSTPGATIVLVIKDSVGNEVGTATTYADQAGNWSTSVHGDIDSNAHYMVEVQQTPNYWGQTPNSGVAMANLYVGFEGAMVAHPEHMLHGNNGDIIGSIVNTQTAEGLINDLVGR